MNTRHLLGAGVACLLGACGGGGGGASGPAVTAPAAQTPAAPAPVVQQPAPAPVTPEPAPVVPAPVVPAPVEPVPAAPVPAPPASTPAVPAPVPTPPPAPFSISPGTVQGTAVAGYAAAITVAATPVAGGTEAAYIGFDSDASTLVAEPTLTKLANGTIEVKLSTLATAPAGRHTGFFTVNVCTTAQCTQQLPGAPFKVPYDISVVGSEGLLNRFSVKPLRKIPGATGWVTVQGNAAHTGYVPVTLDPANFSPRWDFYSPKQGQYNYRLGFTEVAAEAGTVYVGGGGGRDASIQGYMLYALNEEDGQVRWKRDFGGLAAVQPPALGNGKVYAVAGDYSDTTLHAFDQSSGAQAFAKRVGGQIVEYRAPLVMGDMVYSESGTFGGWGGYDGATGEMKLFLQTPTSAHGVAPATDAANIYLYQNNVEVFDRRTGAGVASVPGFAIPSYVDGPRSLRASTTMLGSPGSLIVASVYVLGGVDTVNNRVRWQVLGQYRKSPAFADRTVFALNDYTRELEAYRESDGALLWRWTAGDNVGFASEVLVTNNLVFVSTAAGTYAVDRSTHATVWKHPASGALALSDYGVLYIREGALLHAINVQ